MTKPIAGLAAAILLATGMAGCGKKSEPASDAPAAAEASTDGTAASAGTAQAAPAAAGQEVLPGASSVRSAIEKKDYDTAVGALLALKGAATQGPQAAEYTTLYDEVKFALMDASQTDPKAASALMMLRAASAGR